MPSGRARSALPLGALPQTLVLPAPVVLDAVTAMAAASTRHDVAQAVCRVLLEVEGVRAAAVTRRAGQHAVVIGSAGYACDSMAPGARLPLDSGLPVAEAIRTGELVAQGTGPGWVAVPFGRRAAGRGALLLSLTIAPSAAEDELGRLHRLARALDDALLRAAELDDTVQDLTCLLAGLTPSVSTDEADVAIRQTARDSELGGDVAMSVAAADGGRWLITADVCGSGLPAATGAAAVRTAARALAPLAQGPGHLLQLLDAALRPEAPEGGFVTAVVAHVAAGTLRVASAGHPAPVLLTADGVVEVAVEVGPPLALETYDALPLLAEASVPVPAGALLVLYSDGLVDRRGSGDTDLSVAALLASVRGEPAEVAAALVAAADAAGRATDDTSVLVSRV